MNIIICDDNKKLTSQIEEVIINMNIPNLSCEVFYTGESLLNYCKQENLVQIIFLDIKLEGKDGIEISREIRKINDKVLIIFITQYQEYVYDVFESLPFRFLVKPLNRAKLENVLLEAIEHIKKNEQYYFFKIERTQYQIAYSDILYFEGNGRKVCVHTRNGNFDFYGRMSEVNNTLDKSIFCRIHVSYIVNMDSIRVISEKEITLEDNTILPISKAYRTEVRKLHLKYIAWKIGGGINCL